MRETCKQCMHTQLRELKNTISSKQTRNKFLPIKLSLRKTGKEKNSPTLETGYRPFDATIWLHNLLELVRHQFKKISASPYQ